MPERRSAKTPTAASYEFLFKKPPVSGQKTALHRIGAPG